MNNYINRFRSLILDNSSIDPHDARLRIEEVDRLACCYAPFDHINANAKIVLLGITPGAQQAGNAIKALRSAMLAEDSDSRALEQAKQTASFSGPMRSNLVAMLDRIGMQQALGLDTCARLFDSRTDLVHFTSALRYPVFLDGKDYSGTPPILATPALRDMTRRWLKEEVELLSKAFWVPLGKEPASVLADCIARGELKAERVLAGMPHPSGANAERIAYFLGVKAREDLSVKTNPDLIDAAHKRLVSAVRLLASGESVPDLAPLESVGITSPVLPAASSPAKLLQRGESRVATAASQSVMQAEAIISTQLERIKAGSNKVAGFETKMGRHLAIQRDVQCINVWTEDLQSPLAIAPFERYPANRRRHSNLDAQAPRVGNNRDALLWRLADTTQLADLLTWYARA